MHAFTMARLIPRGRNGRTNVTRIVCVMTLNRDSTHVLTGSYNDFIQVLTDR